MLKKFLELMLVVWVVSDEQVKYLCVHDAGSVMVIKQVVICGGALPLCTSLKVVVVIL